MLELKLNHVSERGHRWHVVLHDGSVMVGWDMTNKCGCNGWTNDLTSFYYSDVITSMMASQITSLTIVYSTVYQRSKKTSKLHITGLSAGSSPVTSLHKGPVAQKMFPFDDVIMMFKDVQYHPFMHWNVWKKNCEYIFSFCMIAQPWYDVKRLNLLYMKIKITIRTLYEIQHISLYRASYQICKIAGCACTRNAMNIFPATTG